MSRMNHQPVSPLPEDQEAASAWLSEYRDRHQRSEANRGILFDEAMLSLQDAALGQIPGDYQRAIEAWIRLGVEGGYFMDGRGTEPKCARLPTPADLDHSSLLSRLLAGENVFHHAPPTMMAYPWVNLVAHRKIRLSIWKDENPLGQPAWADPGAIYFSPSQSTFKVTEQSADGWIYATSSTRPFFHSIKNTFWKIRARQAELSEVEYEEAKRHNTITHSFEKWRRDWPYRVWELEVLNTPEECATYSSIDEILATLRPRDGEIPRG
jgi:hypothetical protein